MMERSLNKPGLRCTANRAQSVEDTKINNAAMLTKEYIRRKVRIHFDGRDGLRDCVIRGRKLWALCELISVGAAGIIPIERPAPRWSAYIHSLRVLGLRIETIRERHGGPYPGNHGRYVLHTPVEVTEIGDCDDVQS